MPDRRLIAAAAFLISTPFWALPADSPAQLLFNRLRDRVLAEVHKAPRYTCVETVVRHQYRPALGGFRSNCQALIAERARLNSPGLEVWRDRLHLDVAIGEDSEIFSWAGAKQFESGDLQTLTLSGSTGSGDFGSFLASVFGADGEGFHYTGEHDTPVGHLAMFEYRVPLAKSHYSFRTNDNQSQTVAYEGSFYAVPATAELRRLIVDAHEFPISSDICRVYDTIDYERVRIGSGDFLLPEVSRMDVLYSTALETLNETHYSGCHEFTGQSTIRFDDPAEPNAPAAQTMAALKSLPPKTRVRVKIDPPIDSDHGAVGDEITGVVEHDVRIKGQTIVRATDKLHGRILRFEQFQFPIPRWVVAIRFDSIERDGVEQPVSFVPVDDGVRTAPPPQYLGRRMQTSRSTIDKDDIRHPKDSGLFVFYDAGKLHLDQKFHSEWETK